MTDFTGTVSKFSGIPFAGKQGPITLYSFQVEGDKRFFRCGTKVPAISVGQPIRFKAEEKNGNFSVDPTTIVPVDESVVTRSFPPTVRAAAAYSNGNAKDTYWADKDAHSKKVIEPRINFSASQRDAVALVTAALEFDCLSFGTVAKGKKLDMLLEFVDQVTDRFVAQRLATGESND
jgi:hypothetical protein